jgi:hypothetical protein
MKDWGFFPDLITSPRKDPFTLKSDRSINNLIFNMEKPVI